jgi:hypothetical protein
MLSTRKMGWPLGGVDPIPAGEADTKIFEYVTKIL